MDNLKEAEELKKCQKENNLKSCLNCEKWENCQIRLKYIQTIYNLLKLTNNERL